MKAYKDRSKEELLTLKNELEAEYKKFQELGLKLDMSRGKPSAEQLDISVFPLLSPQKKRNSSGLSGLL